MDLSQVLTRKRKNRLLHFQKELGVDQNLQSPWPCSVQMFTLAQVHTILALAVPNPIRLNSSRLGILLLHHEDFCQAIV